MCRQNRKNARHFTSNSSQFCTSAGRQWPAAVAAAAATAWLFRHTRTAPPLQQQRQPQRCSEQ